MSQNLIKLKEFLATYEETTTKNYHNLFQGVVGESILICTDLISPLRHP